MTVKTAAEGGFEVRRAELDWTAMDEATRAEFEELFGASDTVTVDPRALERKFTIPERNRAIVRECRSVLENGFTGRDGIRRFPSRGKTIVFAVTKRHAGSSPECGCDAATCSLSKGTETRPKSAERQSGTAPWRTACIRIT